MHLQGDRREFLRAAGIGAGALLAGSLPGVAQEPAQEKSEQDVTAPEDLMREHGVLKRVLLVYDEACRRIDAKKDVPADSLAAAAKIIRTFIEDYHEKLEEQHLFPRFEKAGKLVDLVTILRAQHAAGRRVTEVTLQLANHHALKAEADRVRLADSMRQFVRMYEPHEAREDTVLFPAIRSIVSPHEFDAMGEEFEKTEQRVLGRDGFETMVDRVAGIEKDFGIYDLAQFTPR